MSADPIVNFYVYPSGRFGRSTVLPDDVIKLATGRQSRIDALVIHTAMRDQVRQCYRLPPQPTRVDGVPNDLRAHALQYVEWVRTLPLGKGIQFEDVSS